MSRARSTAISAALLAAAGIACVTAPVSAQDEPRAQDGPRAEDDAGRQDGPDERDPDVASSADALPTYRARARAEAPPREGAGRASTQVTRDEMDERIARSAPDAIAWVPGVSVQQTTHGQASPYVRGVTGQQVLTAFDGVRLNNGTYRQGPNQYFFTIDPAILDRIDVVRGSASTRWGSDAIGGAILAMPAEPTLDPSRDGLHLRPRAIARFGSADLDLGGRLELDAQLSRDVAVLVGGGYRAAQPLQGSGVLTNADGTPARAPLVESDGRTQRGTGFRYATYDGRLVARIAPELSLVAALYAFQQYDTPRSDRCPPPFASLTECLTFLEQFHHLAYLSVRGAAGPELREVDVTLSYQRQHEVRANDRPASFVRTVYRDDVDTVGLAARFGSRRLPIAPDVALVLRGGADAYVDQVHSDAVLTFTDLDLSLPEPRGQYTDGARYATGGIWAEATLDLFRILRIRGGVRGALAMARASAETRSGSAAVSQDWLAPVGRLGAEVRINREVSILASWDLGFRAPNLDDLTSRQVVGPGYQFENPALSPERSSTYEIGARVLTDVVQVDAWLYALQLEGAIVRAPRPIEACPPSTPACAGSWSRFQLVNVPGESWILGGELAARMVLPFGLGASATLGAAWGEGPSPAMDGSRVPLSRVPPVNGTIEVRYAHAETRLVFGAAMRWAAAQDRLAPADLGDARIPIGGTPAYAAFDLRAGWRFERHFQVSAVFENVLDQVYRVHGSGINGAGRGVLVQLQGAY